MKRDGIGHYSAVHDTVVLHLCLVLVPLPCLSCHQLVDLFLIMFILRHGQTPGTMKWLFTWLLPYSSGIMADLSLFLFSSASKVTIGG